MLSTKHQVLPWVAGLILLGLFCSAFWIIVSYEYHWEKLDGYWPNLGRGWLLTVLVSVAALVLSVLFGALLTAAQIGPLRFAQWIARAIVEIVRGTPLLVQILIGYYVVADAVGVDHRFLVGVVVLAAFSGAYLSEIFRGGIESIPESQWSSARAIGLTTGQTYRHVVLPQAVRRVLPGTAGELANLIKNSSLLFVIGLHEFTLAAKEVNAITYATFEPYLPLAVGYLVLTLPISLLARHLEGRFRYTS